MPDRVCAIDIGSNTLLYVVAERAEGRETVRALRDHGRVTGLGRGSFATGLLADDAIARAIEGLRDIANEARALGVSQIRAVGTSALRDATNAQTLIARAAQPDIRIDVEIITGAREARLAHHGALVGIDSDPDEPYVAVDIGGGSTEIATRDQSRSIDVGSVRLFERHLRSDPPTARELAALGSDIDRALDGVVLEPAMKLVALAGTACTIAAIARGVAPFDARAVHGAVVSSEEAVAIATRLASLTIAERRAIASIPEGREDVVVAGALLLARITKHACVDSFVVSDGGVRWGLAREMLQR